MSLQIIDLQKAFVGPDGSRVPVVDVPRFDLAAGEQVALIGSSGSGKTTLLHLIAGILRPDAGRIAYDLGEKGVFDIATMDEAPRDAFRGKHVGYVFQTHHLLPGLTALENVLLGMSFTGRRPDRAWAERLLSEVGLGERLHFKPEKLSLGQQQRVAVARAMANRPRLVLADEPTGALDPATARVVLKLITELCREVNAALILVTHDMQIAAGLSRSVSLAELNQATVSPSVAGGVA